MKNLVIWFVLFYSIIGVQGQKNFSSFKDLSTKQTAQFIAQGYVLYSDFGAIGNGKTDDMEAIVRTHTFANVHHIMVKADEGAEYYIGGTDRTAFIQTDTNFGSATFIIDDQKVKNRKASVFEVNSQIKSFEIDNITSLKKNQDKLDVSLSTPCLITVFDNRKRRYIRLGLNENRGSSQTDVFLVDKEGNVSMETPIIWDFDHISKISATPIDNLKIMITGGQFITIANQEESKYNYYGRNIVVKRSNVIIDGLKHLINGEGSQGAPYRGFIAIANAYNVTVKNTMLTGHKKYTTIGAKGKLVAMGSYDISVNRALTVSFNNCSQSNDITDNNYWGIMASNYSKNILFDNCKLSRFDAHMGVFNATILNSTLGHMGINAIGSGTLTVENSTVRAKSFINLRQDYGSTWQGKFIIRNCIFEPIGKKDIEIYLINGSNAGQHDFGYTCYMPESIIIENLYIDDSHQEDNQNPTIFSDFNSKMVSNNYQEKFPYIKTKRLVLQNISSHNKRNLRISKNPVMFENLQVEGNTNYILF